MTDKWQLTNSNLLRLGAFRDAAQAKRFADKYDRRGTMTVRHQTTGATWQRLKGSWFKTRTGLK